MSILKAYVVPHPPLIIPEIGRGQEKKISNTINSYHQISEEIAALAPETIVIVTPHSVMYADYIHLSPGSHARGNFAQFNAPEVELSVDYDESFVKELEQLSVESNISAGTEGERNSQLDHATLIPLWFIHHAWNKDLQFPKIVRIGLSGLSAATHYTFGKVISAAAEKLNRKVVFIASGDLSHRLKNDGPYGFTKEGPMFDIAITGVLESGDFNKLLTIPSDVSEKAGECGYRSIIMMAGALDGKAIYPKLLSYEGPFGVGYAVASFEVVGEDSSSQFLGEEAKKDPILVDPYVQLAIDSLTHFLKTGKNMKLPDNLPAELTDQRAGVFVTLKKGGELRGCIGTIEPVTHSIAEEIIRNAVSSGTQDPRFPPVRESELQSLTFSVDVLSSPEPIDSIHALDVRHYGVIVSSGYRRGLLLPNLEGVDTVEEQVAIAKRKAGISLNEPAQLERFKVVRHE